MRLRFIDARVWRYSIAALEDLVETALMSVSGEGIRIRAMDPSHVALIDFFVPREAFDIFEVEKEEKIPVNLEAAMKILRRSSKKDELSIEYQPPSVRFGLVSPEGVERYFEFSALTPGAVEEVPELSIDFPVEASIVPQAFKSSYKILSEAGDVLEIVATPEKMLFTTSSETGEIEIELSTELNLLTNYQFRGGERQRSRYTLEYLDKFSRLSMISDSIDLSFGEGLPLKAVARLPRGAWMTIYVAPRED